METERLKRINELAHKEKTEGLAEAEKAEQARLRREYLAAFKKNLVAELDNTYIVDEQGHKRKVRRKDSTMN